MAKRFESDQEQIKVVDPVEPTPPTASETDKQVGKSMLMKVALASVVIAALIISIANMMVTNQLKAQTDEYKAEINAYKEKIARLKYFINKEVDDEYIIEYAREYLDMYFPDEDIYYNDVNE